LDAAASSKARTEAATSSNFSEVGAREYGGCVDEANALATATRDRNNLPAMALWEKAFIALRWLISANRSEKQSIQSVVDGLQIRERFCSSFRRTLTMAALGILHKAGGD